MCVDVVYNACGKKIQDVVQYFHYITEIVPSWHPSILHSKRKAVFAVAGRFGVLMCCLPSGHSSVSLVAGFHLFHPLLLQS